MAFDQIRDGSAVRAVEGFVAQMRDSSHHRSRLKRLSCGRERISRGVDSGTHLCGLRITVALLPCLPRGLKADNYFVFLIDRRCGLDGFCLLAGERTPGAV